VPPPKGHFVRRLNGEDNSEEPDEVDRASEAVMEIKPKGLTRRSLLAK